MRRFAGLTALVLVAAAPAPPATGLDHVPLAVNDLTQFTADVARLGFTLKPGSPHTDGIRNANFVITPK